MICLRGKLSVIAACFWVSGAAWANLRVPALIADHMVLQRDTRIHLWGWGDPGEPVLVKFHGGQFRTTVDSRRHWQLEIGPYAAGGPFEMSLAGHNTLELRDILIGDVWLASGQSNMEFPLRAAGDWRTGVANSAAEINSAHFEAIRLFQEPHRLAFQPAPDVTGAAWRPVDPGSVADFSAVAYLFGRELHQQRHIPIGLIQAAWGGTLAEAWMSAPGVQPFADLAADARSLSKLDQQREMRASESFKTRKAQWWQQHGHDEGEAGWANPDYDASHWPTTPEPRLKAIEGLHSFDGTVWLRKEFELPAPFAEPVRVSIPLAYRTDITYLNGQKIGENTTGDAPRSYVVPAGVARPGRNVLVMKMTGDVGFVGMYGNAKELYVQAGSNTVSLAGTWSYHPGPDLADFPRASRYSSLELDPVAPTILFNGMIAPLTPFKIRGVIWYQGEANATEEGAPRYRTLFPALIRDWRRHWGYEFPFLFVQLAGFGPNQDAPAEYPWAQLREAQFMTLSEPATGMATAVDIGNENDIHPKNKQDVAHRLALVAAHVAYGDDLLCSGPVYESMQIEGNRVRIHFTSVGQGLQVRDRYGYARGFEIAGADHTFKWAQALLDGNDLLVSSPSVPNPTDVRYDWSNTPDGNVYNIDGLPALPFRTR